jgi:hypothetical protein
MKLTNELGWRRRSPRYCLLLPIEVKACTDDLRVLAEFLLQSRVDLVSLLLERKQRISIFMRLRVSMTSSKEKVANLPAFLSGYQIKPPLSQQTNSNKLNPGRLSTSKLTHPTSCTSFSRRSPQSRTSCSGSGTSPCVFDTR